MHNFGPPETVHIENEWYDGPRAGIANIRGRPHRFVSQFDEREDVYLGTFLIWPIEEPELALEREQWLIFVAWNVQYEAGKVDSETHPGHPGANARWDEIGSLLKTCRETVPPIARRAEAEFTHIERNQRYAPSGPAYQLSWRIL